MRRLYRECVAICRAQGIGALLVPVPALASGPTAGPNHLVDLDHGLLFPQNTQNEPATTRDPISVCSWQVQTRKALFRGHMTTDRPGRTPSLPPGMSARVDCYPRRTSHGGRAQPNTSCPGNFGDTDTYVASIGL